MKNSENNFSHKKFAELLGFNQSNIMIEYIKGRRPVSLKAGEQIAKYLKLKSQDRIYFLTLIKYIDTRKKSEREDCLNKILDIKSQNIDNLDKKQVIFYKNWLNAVMLEILQQQDEAIDYRKLVKRFNFRVNEKQLKESFDTLMFLGLVSSTEGRIFVNRDVDMGTSHRVNGVALKKFHSDMIDNAKESLFKMDGKHRDVSSVTISVDSKTAKKIRYMIHEFQVKIIEEADKSETKENVYQLNFQYFPFLKTVRSKNVQ